MKKTIIRKLLGFTLILASAIIGAVVWEYGLILIAMFLLAIGLGLIFSK